MQLVRWHQRTSDLGLQRRSWLDPLRRSPHWSYLEFGEGIPYEDQLNGARNEGWVSPREDEVIDRLCRAVDDYTAPGDDSYGHAAILDDPAWHAVVEVATWAKQQLSAIVTDGDERKALLAPISHEAWR